MQNRFIEAAVPHASLCRIKELVSKDADAVQYIRAEQCKNGRFYGSFGLHFLSRKTISAGLQRRGIQYMKCPMKLNFRSAFLAYHICLSSFRYNAQQVSDFGLLDSCPHYFLSYCSIARKTKSLMTCNISPQLHSVTAQKERLV